MKFVKKLQDITMDDSFEVGNKAVMLGELLKIKIPVPAGFVILNSAFERFLEKTNINKQIVSIWKRINIADIESTKKNLKIIQNSILKKTIPKEIKREIVLGFLKLRSKYVAVRSSSINEDLEINSWAGVLETYINTTRVNLIKNVKKCWASLFSPKVLFYQSKINLLKNKISMGVIIQKMIRAELAGVCFTVHPINKNKNQMLIEAVQGDGLILTKGIVTPDRYLIEKSTLKILNITKNSQNEERIIKLSERQIKKIARICIKIENYFKYPQDIEWVLKKNKIFIVQARPIGSFNF